MASILQITVNASTPISWQIILAKLQQMLPILSNEKQTRKVAVTISMIGKQMYSTLKDLCLPNLPTEKTYDQLTNPKYLKLQNPTISIIHFRVKMKLLLNMLTS